MLQLLTKSRMKWIEKHPLWESAKPATSLGISTVEKGVALLVEYLASFVRNVT
jgi:hypothetical protein